MKKINQSMIIGILTLIILIGGLWIIYDKTKEKSEITQKEVLLNSSFGNYTMGYNFATIQIAQTQTQSLNFLMIEDNKIVTKTIYEICGVK